VYFNSRTREPSFRIFGRIPVYAYWTPTHCALPGTLGLSPGKVVAYNDTSPQLRMGITMIRFHCPVECIDRATLAVPGSSTILVFHTLQDSIRLNPPADLLDDLINLRFAQMRTGTITEIPIGMFSNPLLAVIS
jgi:hypothetical protein